MNTQTTEVKNNNLRKFGFIIGSLFALIFGLFFPWITNKTSQNWPLWPFIVMTVFWIIALVTPQILGPVNIAISKIGNILGWVNSRIILGTMFFLLIFPIGLILKILGKDSMNRKLLKDAKTYRKIKTPRDKNHLEKTF